MLAQRGGARLTALAAAVACFGLVAAGCVGGKAGPTIQMEIVTPTPVVNATPTPTAQPTIAPTPSDPPTPSATTTPTAPASINYMDCSGKLSTKIFWGTVANKMHWDAYCPILPSGWSEGTVIGTWSTAFGGKASMTYAGPRSASIRVDEGNFCEGKLTKCAPGSNLGTASFGDLPGTLVSLPGGGFALYVAPGTSTGYRLIASNVARDQFVALAGMLAKVEHS